MSNKKEEQLQKELEEAKKEPDKSSTSRRVRIFAQPITEEEFMEALSYIKEAAQGVVRENIKKSNSPQKIGFAKGLMTGGVLATLLTLAAQKFTGDDHDTNPAPQNHVAEQIVHEPALN